MGRSADNLDQAAALLEDLESVERKLGQLRDGLTRSHRLATLGTMASIIAHEFNNILTPMISYCQIAMSDPDDTAMLRKAVEKSLRGAERAAQISESMLGFARPGERQGGGACEVQAVVDEVFTCLARPPEKDGLTVDVSVEAGCAVAMAEVELQQVLLNLVLNARHAMGRGRGRLRISARRARGELVAHEPARVVIRVADTGPGIDGSVVDSIFEPFVTHREGGAAAGGRGGKEQGTGLGLAICRELVEAAGGRIAVEETSPSGTTFRIDLPAAELEAGRRSGGAETNAHAGPEG